MRAIVVTIIVLYVLLAFIGCLDRQRAIESAHGRGGKEKRNEEIGAENRRGVRGSVGVGGDNHRRVENPGSLATGGGSQGLRPDD